MLTDEQESLVQRMMPYWYDGASNLDMLRGFVALAYRLGVAAERKRCMKVCNSLIADNNMQYQPWNALTASEIRKAIERGEDA